MFKVDSSIDFEKKWKEVEKINNEFQESICISNTQSPRDHYIKPKDNESYIYNNKIN